MNSMDRTKSLRKIISKGLIKTKSFAYPERPFVKSKFFPPSGENALNLKLKP